MMKTGEQVFAERGGKPNTPEGSITLAEFQRVGLPMVVACVGCAMTMNFFSALVDEDGRIWCRDCAGNGELGDVAEDDPRDRAWQRYDLYTQPDGTIRGEASTNDDNDDGYPDGTVDRWPLKFQNREDALKHFGTCRFGISGIEVEVTLDGERIV